MNGEERFFLDVRRSVRGIAWRHRLTGRQEAIALAIAQGNGVPEIVARVLAARGVTAEDAARFLDPTVRDLLPDPASLTDMVKAGARIADAILRGERVAIFGDYDVDGAASSALLKRFLAHYGVPAEIYIPDRIFEGYGPNPGGDARTGRPWRNADRHGRLRHQQRGFDRRRARRPAPMSSCSIITRSAVRCRTPLPSSIPIARTTCPGRGTFAPPA